MCCESASHNANVLKLDPKLSRATYPLVLSTFCANVHRNNSFHDHTCLGTVSQLSDQVVYLRIRSLEHEQPAAFVCKVRRVAQALLMLSFHGENDELEGADGILRETVYSVPWQMR